VFLCALCAKSRTNQADPLCSFVAFVVNVFALRPSTARNLQPFPLRFLSSVFLCALYGKSK
jgi:hypothetical protein